MDDVTRYTIGSKVRCGTGDDACGRIKRVVVEPIDRVLTHLVVGPGGRGGTDRLVPVALVDAVGSATGEVRLTCTATKFATLENAEETHLVSAGGGVDEFGGQAGNQAYLGIGTGGAGGGLASAGSSGTSLRRRPPRQVTYEKVPEGEIQVRRGERVRAVDGSIGRLQGLVVDPGNHHVTHMLLDEGHLWTHKRVAIPIGVVADVDSGVRINLTKGQIRELPPVDLDRDLEPAEHA